MQPKDVSLVAQLPEGEEQRLSKFGIHQQLGKHAATKEGHLCSQFVSPGRGGEGPALVQRIAGLVQRVSLQMKVEINSLHGVPEREPLGMSLFEGGNT